MSDHRGSQNDGAAPSSNTPHPVPLMGVKYTKKPTAVASADAAQQPEPSESAPKNIYSQVSPENPADGMSPASATTDVVASTDGSPDAQFKEKTPVVPSDDVAAGTDQIDPDSSQAPLDKIEELIDNIDQTLEEVSHSRKTPLLKAMRENVAAAADLEIKDAGLDETSDSQPETGEENPNASDTKPPLQFSSQTASRSKSEPSTRRGSQSGPKEIGSSLTASRLKRSLSDVSAPLDNHSELALPRTVLAVLSFDRAAPQPDATKDHDSKPNSQKSSSQPITPPAASKRSVAEDGYSSDFDYDSEDNEDNDEREKTSASASASASNRSSTASFVSEHIDRVSDDGSQPGSSSAGSDRSSPYQQSTIKSYDEFESNDEDIKDNNASATPRRSTSSVVSSQEEVSSISSLSVSSDPSSTLKSISYFNTVSRISLDNSDVEPDDTRPQPSLAEGFRGFFQVSTYVNPETRPEEKFLTFENNCYDEQGKILVPAFINADVEVFIPDPVHNGDGTQNINVSINSEDIQKANNGQEFQTNNVEAELRATYRRILWAAFKECESLNASLQQEDEEPYVATISVPECGLHLKKIAQTIMAEELQAIILANNPKLRALQEGTTNVDLKKTEKNLCEAYKNFPLQAHEDLKTILNHVFSKNTNKDGAVQEFGDKALTCLGETKTKANPSSGNSLRM